MRFGFDNKEFVYIVNHRKAISRIFFALFAQALIGAMSVLTSFVLPARIGPEEFGYYQVFAFYLSYLNVVGVGVNDGITLNYAGCLCDENKKKKIRSALGIQIGYVIIISVVFVLIAFLQKNPEKMFIILMLGLNLIPTILFCLESGIFLAENKSYLFNISSVLQKAVFCVLLVALLLNEFHMFRWIILSQTVSNYLVTIVFFLFAKDYFWGALAHIKEGFKELCMLCSSGVLVALSVALGGLIPSLGRIIVENLYPISEYGVFSFYISLLSIVLAFTNAVGIVVFPIMRNSHQDRVKKDYKLFSKAISAIGSLIYLSYPVILWIIRLYLSEYAVGIKYLVFLLPVCYPIAKIQMLMTPYYKMCREERRLFFVNLHSIIVTFVIEVMFYSIFKSITSIAVATLISCDVYYLLMMKNLPSKGDTRIDLWEFVLQFLFVLLVLFLSMQVSTILMFVLVGVTAILRRRTDEDQLDN